MQENSATVAKSKRLLSIDALRGFDMLFISGGGAFIYYLHGKTSLAWVDALAIQMEHTTWNGFTFYDFIFPLFLFISGVSVSFSLKRNIEKGVPKSQLYKKAFIRMVVLMLLGFIYKNSPVHIFAPSTLRYSSVLGRIGIATFATTLLYLNFSATKRLFWVIGILLAYYAALFLIPVPGFGAGDISFEGNLVGWFDRSFMPGILHQKIYDENAILTQFPALTLAVLGAWAGDILNSKNLSENRKVIKMVIIGVSSIIIALIWNMHFPINKRLWSSSFIALTGGMAFLTMALFYWLIDVLNYRKWAFVFKVIGMNSLVIYFANHFIDFRFTAAKLFDGVLVILDERWHESIIALLALGLVWLFLYFLYRNKMFLKI